MAGGARLKSFVRACFDIFLPVYAATNPIVVNHGVGGHDGYVVFRVASLIPRRPCLCRCVRNPGGARRRWSVVVRPGLR